MHFNQIIEDDYTEESDNPFFIRDLVEYFLTFEAKKLTDYLDETELLSDQVHKILYDPEEDKIGRIKDLYDAEITRVAKWVDEHHEYNNHAKYILQSALGDR